MHTIITYPGAAAHEQHLAAIEAYTVGAKALEDYGTVTGARLLFATNRDGNYIIHVHGSGYHRLSVTDNKGDALRLLELLKETHGIASEAIG